MFSMRTNRGGQSAPDPQRHALHPASVGALGVWLISASLAGGTITPVAAQSGPSAPSPSQPPPTAQPTGTDPAVELRLRVESLAQNVTLLKDVVSAQLQGTNVGIEAMREANARQLLLFGFLGAVGTLFGVATLYRARQEHEDYKHERQFYESRTARQEERNLEEHRVNVDFQGATRSLLTLQEDGVRQVNQITSAIAAGAEKNVQNLNAIIGTFQQIMEFKVQEARDAKVLRDNLTKTEERLATMGGRLDEMDTAQREQVEELLQRAVRLRVPRYRFARPDPDLQREIVEFRIQMDLIQRSILAHHTGAKEPTQHQSYGEVYFRRGVIAYYDNDILKARTMLKTAERYFPFSEHAVEAMDRDQRIGVSFIQFYLALIEKNYGEIGAARSYIDNAFVAFGRNELGEILTPTTRAEILTNLGNMEVAREAIHQLLERIGPRIEQKILPEQDAIYANRSRLLLGDTYYVQEQWDKARTEYESVQVDAAGNRDYFVSYALSQVHARTGDASMAARLRSEAHASLVRSEHLRTKTALDTRLLLNTLGYLCLRSSAPDQAEKYAIAIKDLWGRIQNIDGLQLRLFSFEKKRLVAKDEFFTEVFASASAV
jgi:tetratricopeptide (TPR) repeat protein